MAGSRGHPPSISVLKHAALRDSDQGRRRRDTERILCHMSSQHCWLVGKQGCSLQTLPLADTLCGHDLRNPSGSRPFARQELNRASVRLPGVSAMEANTGKGVTQASR